MPVADGTVGAQQEDAGQSTGATGLQEDGELKAMREVQIHITLQFHRMRLAETHNSSGLTDRQGERYREADRGKDERQTDP